MLFALYRTSFESPGNIPEELKGPDLQMSELD